MTGSGLPERASLASALEEEEARLRRLETRNARMRTRARTRSVPDSQRSTRRL